MRNCHFVFSQNIVEELKSFSSMTTGLRLGNASEFKPLLFGAALEINDGPTEKGRIQ